MKNRLKHLAGVLLTCTVLASLFSADLYAQPVERGRYPTQAGTILVTPNNQNKLARVFKLGHAGIVLNKSTSVEATLPTVTVSRNNWKNRSQVRTLYAVKVKNVSSAKASKVANWCRKQTGKGYNKNYSNITTRKKFYCSHLVWAGYKDVCRVDLNTGLYGKMVAPIELVNTPKTSLVYSYKR